MVMMGNCSCTTVIVPLPVAVQPFVFVTVTVYVVVAVGLTVSVAVVTPVFHRYELPPDTVSDALDPVRMIPSLITPEFSVTDTEGVGSEFTVIADETDE